MFNFTVLDFNVIGFRAEVAYILIYYIFFWSFQMVIFCIIFCIITVTAQQTQDVYHILSLSSIGTKPYLFSMAFTLFVTPTKDNNNHDNLIFKRRGCSRARYKETINEYGRDKQWDTERGRLGV